MSFEFLPKTLVAKCNRLIKAHHGTHGYSTLPHLLWQDEETRQFMEAHDELRLLFKKASITRGAKKANEYYMVIITIMLSLEILASDFAGWGSRFPGAKRKATAMILEYLPSSRIQFMDFYLPPRGQWDRDRLKSVWPD